MKSNKEIIEEVLTDSLKETNLTDEQKKLISFDDRIKDTIKKALKIEEDEILKEIDEEIKRQKELITEDFEKDKPFNWRIDGMKYLKSIIENQEKD